MNMLERIHALMLLFAVAMLFARSAAYKVYLPPSLTEEPSVKSIITKECQPEETSTLTRTVWETDVKVITKTEVQVVEKAVTATITTRSTSSIFKTNTFPLSSTVTTTLVLQSDVVRNVVATRNTQSSIKVITRTITQRPTSTIFKHVVSEITDTAVDLKTSPIYYTVTTTSLTGQVVQNTFTATNYRVKSIHFTTETVTDTHTLEYNSVLVPPTRTETLIQTKFLITTSEVRVPGMTMTQTKTVTETVGHIIKNFMEIHEIKSHGQQDTKTVVVTSFATRNMVSSVFLDRTDVDHRVASVSSTLINTVLITQHKDLVVTNFNVQPAHVQTEYRTSTQTTYVTIQGKDLDLSNTDKISVHEDIDKTKIALYSRVEHATVSNVVGCPTSATYDYQEPSGNRVHGY